MASMSSELQHAFDRLADFEAVQRGRSMEELIEAVCLLQESVGIDEQARALIRDRLGQRGRVDGAGTVLLGVIVGLMAAELAAEAN